MPTLLQHLKLFAISLPVFLALDLLWLGVLMKNFYAKELGSLARRSNGAFAPHLTTGVLAYVLLALGVALYVLPKFQDKHIGLETFGTGALLGLIIYGVYDLTNYATLAKWPPNLVVVDMLWGMVVYGLTSLLAGLLARYLSVL
jgi:uncharacterized membrane protein